MTYEELHRNTEKKAIELGKEETAVFYYLLHIFNISQTELYSKYKDSVDMALVAEFNKGIDKYFYENTPIQYLIGTQNFFGHEFICNENVLIPRFETEELVENVLMFYDEYFDGKTVDLCDIGTGSGCIAITLSKEESNFNVVATDISLDALKVAKQNNAKLGCNVEFLQGDMVKPLFGRKFDIIVSNPPYIPDSEEVESLVVNNEPNVALFGGVDGMDFYKIIVRDSKNICKDKFMFAFEHAYNKNKEMKEIILEHYPNALIIQKKDMQGKDRMTFAFIGF